MATMTNGEIQELIASYSSIANKTVYSDNTRAAARRKVAQLQSESDLSQRLCQPS